MSSSKVFRSAESLLRYLSVETPQEIDVEAIAAFQGVEVIYRRLDGCDAQIVGHGGRAVATIDSHASKARQRFSIAHELGHWNRDRGRVQSCRLDDTERPPRRSGPERGADHFAADLLLPGYLFVPMAKDAKRCTVEVANNLALAFDASLTATLIRLAEIGPEPSILVSHGPNGRKWFTQQRAMARTWFPREEIDARSSTLDVQYGHQFGSARRAIPGDAWFADRAVARHHVYEQAVRISDTEVLSIITLPAELVGR